MLHTHFTPLHSVKHSVKHLFNLIASSRVIGGDFAYFQVLRPEDVALNQSIHCEYIDIILISNIFQHYPTLCIYSPFSSKVIPESSSSSVCPSSAAQEKPTCSLQVVSMTCSTTCKLLRTRGSTRNQGISRPATLDLSKVRRPAR